MRNIISTIVLLIFIFTKASAQIEIQWQKCIGGSESDLPNKIIQTAEGGYIFAGQTASIDGDIVGMDGWSDLWVVKLDYQGNMQWQKCLGGSFWNSGNSIIQTSDGGYTLIGNTSSNDGDVSGNHGNQDVWIVNLDAQGNLLWQKCLGGTGYETGYSLVQTMDGGYIAAAITTSNDGNVSGNHGGTSDIWVIKLDPTGNIQWQKCLGGSAAENFPEIIQTFDHGYALVCETESEDGDVVGSHGWTELWTVKLSPAGNIQWAKCFGGSQREGASAIIQTEDGKLVIGGYTYSNDGNISANQGGSDMWIIKLDTNGSLIWQRNYGGISDEAACSLIQNHDHGITIGGYAWSNNGDVTGHHGTVGTSDIWVVNLDPQGNLIWEHCLGGSDEESYSKIIQAADGGYVIAGRTLSNDGDVIGNQHPANIFNTESEAWIIKLQNQNIKGHVYHDSNTNGFNDAGELGFAAHLIKKDPGSIFTFTDNNGNYFFRSNIGNHVITYIPNNYWQTTTQGLYNISIDSTDQLIDTLDFGLINPLNLHDVSVYITGSSTQAGFETRYWLNFKNNGTVTENGTIEFTYDPLLTFNGSTTPPLSHTGNLLIFSYDTLGPSIQRTIRLDFQVPGVQNMGDTLENYASIQPFVTDTFLTNNFDTISQIITAAYDPNDKTVSPTGIGNEGNILHGQRLTYTIRFQNTGTDTALNVVIRDTINTNLDFSTFQLEASSHPVQLSLHNNNELVFRFENIELPDSNVNEPASHGFLRYSISPKTGLSDHTQVLNTAYIFFDYNPAIITQTTHNTYVSTFTNAVINKTAGIINTWPNPSKEIVYINLPENTHKIEVYNTKGSILKQIIPHKQVAEININDLPNGIYVVKIHTDKESITTKFIKE